MKAVLYCRVSSRDQEETGYSLPAQEKDYALRKNISIVTIITTAESASRKKRRQVFNEMLKYIKKEKIRIIICEKIDRFTRSHKDAVTIDNWVLESPENQVHFVKNYFVLNQTTKASDRFMWNIHVSKAEYDLDNLSEEVKKGQMEKIESGWSPVRTPPLGYKNVRVEGKVIQIIDEEKAPLMKRLFTLYATGNYSVEKLCMVMHEEGLRSNSGNAISVSRMYNYLTNPFYTGKFVWNNVTYTGKHPQLLDIQTAKTILAILKKGTTPKYNIHKFMFKGLLRCAECTGIITWETHKGIIYGHCNHYRACKQTVWVKEYEIENQLIHALELLQIKNQRIAAWIQQTILDSHADQITYHKKVVTDITSNIAQVQHRIDALIDMRADNEIDKDTYTRKRAGYIEEKEALETSLKNNSEFEEKYAQLECLFFDISQKAQEYYERLLPDKKRVLLSLIYASITLDQGVISYTYTKPFQILAKAVEITNSSKMVKNAENQKKILELNDKLDIASKKTLSLPAYSVLRRGGDSNP